MSLPSDTENIIQPEPEIPVMDTVELNQWLSSIDFTIPVNETLNRRFQDPIYEVFVESELLILANIYKNSLVYGTAISSKIVNAIFNGDDQLEFKTEYDQFLYIYVVDYIRYTFYKACAISQNCIVYPFVSMIWNTQELRDFINKISDHVPAEDLAQSILSTFSETNVKV